MAASVESIESAVRAALPVDRMVVIDDSAAHAGHAGARDGGGHYTLRIVSSAFAGKTLVARHRLVYDALRNLMQREIHALAIEAKSPDEPNV